MSWSDIAPPRVRQPSSLTGPAYSGAPADSQIGGLAEHQAARRGRVPLVQPQLREQVKEGRYGDPRLQPGQVSAEAEVRAVREGQVAASVRPPDLEFVGIIENPGVPVRPGDGHRHLITGPNPSPAELGVAGRVTVDDGCGRFKPQRLLDRRRDQPAVE